MKVFCSLPLSTIQPALIQRLGRRGINLHFKICSLENIKDLYRVVVLEQVDFNQVCVELSVESFSSDTELIKALRLLSGFGFINVLLVGWVGHSLDQVFTAMESLSMRAWFQVLNLGDLDKLCTERIIFSGLWLKGHEAAGLVGGEHIHILFHATLNRFSVRTFEILVDGGIGIESAGALSLLGADGVVLSDQLKFAYDYPLTIGSPSLPTGAHDTIAIQITAEYFLRIPKSFASGIQQEIEAKIAYCYPLGCATSTPGLLKRIFQELIDGESNLARVGLGQDICFAKNYAEKYHDVCGIALAFKRVSGSARHCLRQVLDSGLVCDSRFSSELGISHDLFQGPMTRVSDTAEFISAVSQHGALPFFAAAMLSPKILEDKLLETRSKLAGRPWGVGLLGFLPPKLRSEQFQIIRKIKPPFVLIAGGRPDQAHEFEESGIKTFIHAPTFELFKQYIEDGATRLVLEGRECGGHVGPIGSMVLWEQCLFWIESAALPNPRSSYYLILAGGISTVSSSASVRLLSSRAKKSGIRVGLLMGTPYLYTDEAVSTGAIVESYRDVVISSQGTINLETGAGHASRCAITPFAKEFNELKASLISSGITGYQLRERLEALTLGRLRIATKGIKRNGDGYVSVESDQAYEEGMYMIGQSAALLSNKTSVSELHSRVTHQAEAFIKRIEESKQQAIVLRSNQYEGKIAIIAMDCIMPSSPDLNRFWEILASGESVIEEVNPERWDPALYYDSDSQQKDRVLSKWGGFLPPIHFSPAKHGIPPVSIKKIEPLQILTLELITRLFDSSSIELTPEIREGTSIFLGAGGGIGDMGGKYAARSEVERLTGSEKSDIYSRLPEWGDETFPGLLFNVVAGRVANRLDFKGANFTVDAACASSLAAIYTAYRELSTHNCDLAIAGGVDTGQSPFAYLCFSRSQALSPTGQSRPFDKSADGIVISEGLGVIVMKRLSDALESEDSIIAVIEGVGASSDGRGSSLTSPQTTGQQLAIERAWRSAGTNPSEMSLYEAHGTGTIAGDRTELSTLSTIGRDYSLPPHSCAVYSTKPNIGHTKSSAGIAGLMHAALCLQNRIHTPCLNAGNPVDILVEPESPYYLNLETCFWHSKGAQRKAGVSAFGFGGTNFHLALSESPRQAYTMSVWPQTSHYLFLWAADSEIALRSHIDGFHAMVSRLEDPSLHAIAFQHWCTNRVVLHGSSSKAFRASIVASSVQGLIQSLTKLSSTALNGEVFLQLDRYTSISCADRSAVPTKIIFLVPGQGSLNTTSYYELIHTSHNIKDQLDVAAKAGALDSDMLVPLQATTSVQLSEVPSLSKLSSSCLQPLIVAIQMGILHELYSYNLTPDLVVGHSLGELTALGLAGLWPNQSSFYQSLNIRGKLMDECIQCSASTMVATSMADVERLRNLLSGFSEAYISNHNSPDQITISCASRDVDPIITTIQAEGHKATHLRVAGGFHSPYMDKAAEKFGRHLQSLHFHPPAINVMSLINGERYADDRDAICEHLSAHMSSSVLLTKGIAALDKRPILFIDIGPSQTMMKLVKQNRANIDDIFICLDSGDSDISGYYCALARLFSTVLDFRPDLCRDHAQPYFSDNSREASKTAIVKYGMAYQEADVPYPSQSPPLNSSTVVNTLVHDLQTNHSPHLDSSTKIAPFTSATSSPQPSLTSSQPTSIMDSINNPVLKAYSIYNETLRSLLSSQERITLGLFSVNGLDPSRIVDSQATPALPQLQDESLISPKPRPKPHAINFSFPQPIVDLAASTPTTPSQHQKPVPSVANKSADDNLNAEAAHDNQLSKQSSDDIIHDYFPVLIRTISELTGYPEDMLTPSMALEADLGIDSIKRVEILSRIQKLVDPNCRDAIKSKADELASVALISDIAEVLNSTLASSGK